MGDVVERHLEGVMLPHLKLQDGAVEIGRAPVPALHAQLLVQHVQAVAAGEVGRHPLPFRLLKARKPREQNTLLEPLPVPGENFFYNFSYFYLCGSTQVKIGELEAKDI